MCIVLLVLCATSSCVAGFRAPHGGHSVLPMAARGLPVSPGGLVNARRLELGAGSGERGESEGDVAFFEQEKRGIPRTVGILSLWAGTFVHTHPSFIALL